MSNHLIPLADGDTVITPASIWETNHVTIIPPPGGAGFITLQGATAVDAAFEAVPDGFIDLSAPHSVRFTGPLQRLKVSQSGVTGSGDITLVLNQDGNIQQGRGYTGFVDGVRKGAYTGDEAIVAVSSIEMNIRRGNQFALSYPMLSIPAGGDVWIAAVAGPTLPAIVKTRQISTNGGMTYTPRRNAVFTVGTEIPNVNLNNLSANVSGLKFYQVPAGNISNPGIVFDTVKSTEGVGSNRKQGVFDAIGIERVIAPIQQVLINFHNDDSKAIYIVFDTTWYEGIINPGPDNPA